MLIRCLKTSRHEFFFTFFERRTLTSIAIRGFDPSTMLSISKIEVGTWFFTAFHPKGWHLTTEPCNFSACKTTLVRFASCRTRNCNNAKQKDANNHSKWCCKSTVFFYICCFDLPRKLAFTLKHQTTDPNVKTAREDTFRPYSFAFFKSSLIALSFFYHFYFKPFVEMPYGLN